MNIRRYYVPNSIVFITQVVSGRSPVFASEEHLGLLLDIVREAKARHPFHMLAYVFLWDHFHLLIKPRTGVTHTDIMHSIKPNFTNQYKAAIAVSGRMVFWQRRYWDHVIRNEVDLAQHFDYIHYNPVKHGMVTKPEEWPHSSFLHWQQQGSYPERWGWALPSALLDFNDRMSE